MLKSTKDLVLLEVDALRQRLQTGKISKRNRKLAEIEDENIMMLKRIQSTKPVYKTNIWKKDEEDRLRLKKICQM